MIIKNYQIHSSQELNQIIKNTSLRGAPDVHPFENAFIVMKLTNPKDTIPTQAFVLQEQLNVIDQIYYNMRRNSVDIFKTMGFITYNTDDSDQQFVFTPPIIELIDNQPLVIDGQHRLTYAMEHNLRLYTLVIDKIPTNMLPYQLPLPGGWNAVQRFEKRLPDGFVRKQRRYNGDENKFYFREYPFPGIIKIAREHTGR